MRYQISDGTVSVGGKTVLSHIDFEIRGREKIAVTGRNGAGKTTLLRLIGGELSLDRDDKRKGAGIVASRQLTFGLLGQNNQPDPQDERTLEEMILEAFPRKDRFSRERFEYEREYDRIFTGLGFQKAEKEKKRRDFSGGEQTKLALIRLLMEQPDVLLLDEPTNHLDLEAVEWLERYIKDYPGAVVMVSHDRFFLDRTAQTVYELERGRLTRYAGNYTDYRREKAKQLNLRRRAYERQEKEEERLRAVVERFKHKPKKASFARAKRRQLERMERVEKPENDGRIMVTGPIEPLVLGNKWVFQADRLRLGYEKPLLELSFRIRRGQKIGLIGPNGAGKSTLLKTIAGLAAPLGGEYSLGERITIGYFDQHSAQIQSEQSVLEHFSNLFPSLSQKEARNILGGYLFGGAAAQRPVNALSGGERARLVLAELLYSRPNFLILDEPTNHMDIQAKETLEAAFRAYTGTILFVSHDRYFVDQIADSILIFEKGRAMYYPFSYGHYLERREKEKEGGTIAARMAAEEQALIAGLKSVPKAERHRLREFSAEEAYKDWRLGLALQEMEPAGERYRNLEEQLSKEALAMEESPEFWMEAGGFWKQEDAGPLGEPGASARLEARRERLKELCREKEGAWEQWHESCMRWFEEWEEAEKEG